MSLLVPIDLSAPSRCALGVAARVGRMLGEDALLLHVSSGPTPLGDLALLHALSGPLRAAGIHARLREVVGEPAERICAEASARKVPWVILGTRGASPVLTGSVARGVLRRCRAPVIAVRPGRGVEHDWLMSPDQALDHRPRVGWCPLDAAASAALSSAAHLLTSAVEGQIRPFLLERLGSADLPDLLVVPFPEENEAALDGLLDRVSCPVALVGLGLGGDSV